MDMKKTRYRIDVETHGIGGFGKVAKGFDEELGRAVAIKTLDPLMAKASDADKLRFKREARILAGLRHPNIPSIYDIEFEDGHFRIIFEFVSGTNLREILNEGPAALVEVQRWFSQIASAISHAHSKNVVHRDVKPENLVVTDDRQHCYLVDFGIALSLSDKERISKGEIFGTPGYMSPEHENGEDPAPIDDVYVLGVCLYEALCGHRIPPGDYENLSTRNESIPPSIDQLILSCIAPKSQRLTSASEFARRLNQALATPVKLSEVLVNGQLHEIVLAIGEMTAHDFMQIKAGQRLLVLNKAMNVINSEDEKVIRARTEFLTILPRLAIHVEGEIYRKIITKALEEAFVKRFGTWIGDRRVRAALETSSEEVQTNHSVFCEEVLRFLTAQSLEEQQPWFFHTMRSILNRLMANSECSDQNAVQLNVVLERINELQRQRSPVFDESRLPGNSQMTHLDASPAS